MCYHDCRSRRDRRPCGAAGGVDFDAAKRLGLMAIWAVVSEAGAGDGGSRQWAASRADREILAEEHDMP